ncbi:hypothetical protein GHT06_020042 [Daphnia sinensis]|uniref:limulus clotting factor C n=1 Tax=Daphnia sinensis TaxID=1820382 RepID=A0AAD5L3U4_9CRUS|nr:hypothetical protein GHT06_020042 [Daphnia sinensis]
MGMTKSNEFAAVWLAAIILLGDANARIYQTKDAIVFEVSRMWDGAPLAKSFPLSLSDFVPIESFLNGGDIPNWHIPYIEPVPQFNSYNNDLHPRQGPTFYSWLHHPLVYVVPAIDSRTGQTAGQESKQNRIRCGAGPDDGNRIVNGEEAIPNSWPFVVGFMEPGSGFVNCGGSLISENKILSAAHCFERKSMYQLSRMVVKLGMHDVGDDKGKPDDAQMTRRISRMTIHKAYNAKTIYFDIAIVTMDLPVAYSKAISPVCLAPLNHNVNTYAGEKATVMGWGRLKAGGESSQQLMQTTVPIITNAECKEILPADRIANHMICASSFPTSSCRGDSGGPLVVKSKGGSWIQVGIVSWGASDCTDELQPAAVYTRVAWLRSWINGNMRN